VNDSLAAIVERLESLGHPVAVPTTQTDDMGLEYLAASTEGAVCALGRYGAWPAYGPFVLADTDVAALARPADDPRRAGMLAGSGVFALIGAAMDTMAAFHELSAAQADAYRRRFLQAVADRDLREGATVYVYFHPFDGEHPIVLPTLEELQAHFMAEQPLTPWNTLGQEELAFWEEKLAEHEQFALIKPDR